MNPLRLSPPLTRGTTSVFNWDSTMIRIQLPPSDVERLDALFRSTTDRKLRDRLQIVRMAQRGRPRQDIAADLGVHRRTVTRWLNAYCAAGLDGLQPKKAKGNPSNLS